VPPTISVCITTCNRPALLAEAIASCLNQELLPIEIVIGDDSTSGETAALVEERQRSSGVRMSYRRNHPRLGQNLNINSVFQRAQGTHLVLLHDDDLLTPNALRKLLGCWTHYPELTAAYGKQYVISDTGVIDERATEQLNADYKRTPATAGLQPRAWEVGISQQFPNDGYMVLTSAAQAILWRSRSEVGYGGEYDFGLRLAATYSGFFFLDTFTAKYRLTAGVSISSSRSDDAALQSFKLLSALDVPPESLNCKAEKLRDLAPTAIAQAINFGKKSEARAMYFSASYPLQKRIGPGGIKKLLALL
jgi:glycosyltransferase involved in cell wall biosynthesis